MRTVTALLFALSLATAGCGDPLVFAEIEEPRACITQASQTFPGLPVGTTLPPGVTAPLDLSHEDSFNIGKTVLAVKATGTTGVMKALDYTMTASNNVDLSGVTTATVLVLPPSTTATLTEQAILTLGADGHPSASSLFLAGSGVDILPYVTTGLLKYRFVATGTASSLPEGDWTAGLTLCLYLKIKVDLGQLAR